MAAEAALNIDFSVHLLYDNKSFRTSFVLISAAVAELADARDLKSLGSDTVPVRSRSAAFTRAETALPVVSAFSIGPCEAWYAEP